MKQNVAGAEATVALARLRSRQTRPRQGPRMFLAGPKYLGEPSLSAEGVCALAEPCGSIAVGAGGFGAAGVAASQ